MESLKICFNDHFGGCYEDSNIVLYESPWNDFGYHGLFEFQLRERKKYCNYKFQLKGVKWLHICRIDGSMKKRHELCNRYNSDVAYIPGNVYIAFPSVELCTELLLNYPLNIRKMIATGLCFNFGDDSNFRLFKQTEQYRKAILRGISEEDFLTRLKLCEKILFNELPLSDLLSDSDIQIKPIVVNE